MIPFGESGCDSDGLPDEITADGRTRTVTQHMQNQPNRSITEERVRRVLERWTIRGIYTEDDGTQSWIYLAFIPGLSKMLRVAVSIDDERIVTAFQDRTATQHWNRGNLDYFRTRYQNVEVRDANYI